MTVLRDAVENLGILRLPCLLRIDGYVSVDNFKFNFLTNERKRGSELTSPLKWLVTINYSNK